MVEIQWNSSTYYPPLPTRQVHIEFDTGELRTGLQ